MRKLLPLSGAILAMVAGWTPAWAWAENPPADPVGSELLPELSPQAILWCRDLTLRALPEGRYLGQEDVGAAVAMPGGPGWTAGGGDWVPVAVAETALAVDGEEPADLLVLLRSGWQRGVSYRVELTPALVDGAGRSFGANESLEWTVPAGTATDPDPPVPFEQRFAISYESYVAASDQLDGRFPGGQNSLFQGLWTDPVTGVAYARARWYDGRNASWLSEDPYNAVDSPNLYAFVGWQPNMATDPEGEVALVDNVVGGVVSVAVGMAIEGLITWLDDDHEFSYTWKDAGVDFGLGFLTSGLSSVGKLKHLNKLGTASRVAFRIGADAALDTVGEIARKEWKGEEYTAKEILTGAGFNFVIGESGALAAKAFKKLRRSFDFGDLGDAAARGIREGTEELAPSVSRAFRNNAEVPRSGVGELFRRGSRVNEVELIVPARRRAMLRAARENAERAGIDLTGIKVRIRKGWGARGSGLFGRTRNRRGFDLFEDAFSSSENLVRTLAHERAHVMHLRRLGLDRMPDTTLLGWTENVARRYERYV